MKTILATVLTALVFGVSPAWAGGGHGHGHDKHAEKHLKKAHKHWAKHHRHVEEHVVVHQYYHPAPRVVEYRHIVAASPPPGVHVVMPSIYFPF